MSYTALYRKFRPVDFHDVKGQDHIVTTLRNQLLASRIGHAYLFTGTRGTGKTSVAKIFAKAVNCENAGENGPCNECAMCRAIHSQASMNVIEIDAASNNGVDNIREIIEEVQYSPAEGRFKVYIIDEVHMLSAGAFNALLKTLEEPPSYVIFILATTEVHKIPITILSRCQRYDFKRITIDVVADRLRELVDKEGVQAEDKALRYVAKAADGSLRDGLSLLDQCMAFHYGKELTYQNVLEVLGAVDIDIFHKMFHYIIGGNVGACMEMLETIILEGRELTQFVVDFVWYFRNLLLVKTSEDAADMIDLSADNLHLLQEEAKNSEVEIIMRYIRIFSDLSNQMKYAVQKRVLVEVAMIKLCQPQMENDTESLWNRIVNIEKQLEGKTMVPQAAKERTVATVPVEKPPTVLSKAIPEELKSVAKNWSNILAKLSAVTRSMLAGVVPSIGEGNCLLLVFQDEVGMGYFQKDQARIQEVEEVIRNLIQKEVGIQTKYLQDNGSNSGDIPDLTKIIKMEIEYED